MAESGQRNASADKTRGYLEDKPLMDEFVALYLGLQSTKLEQQFRE